MYAFLLRTASLLVRKRYVCKKLAKILQNTGTSELVPTLGILAVRVM